MFDREVLAELRSELAPGEKIGVDGPDAFMTESVEDLVVILLGRLMPGRAGNPGP
jgi:hypothetical protein